MCAPFGAPRRVGLRACVSQLGRHLADELHDLVQVVLLLQDLAYDLADVGEVGVKLLVEGLQRLRGRARPSALHGVRLCSGHAGTQGQQSMARHSLASHGADHTPASPKKQARSKRPHPPLCIAFNTHVRLGCSSVWALECMTLHRPTARPLLPLSGPASSHASKRQARLGVLGVGDEPVHARKVLALRQLLVQAPEHLRPWRRPLNSPAHCMRTAGSATNSARLRGQDMQKH